MQVCTSLQSDNHASTPGTTQFFTGRMPFLRPTSYNYMEKKSHTTLVFVLVLLIITYYIHHHILHKSQHWNHWTAINPCLYNILNTKLDEKFHCHSVFNIIQKWRNSYSMCICLLLHCKWRTAMSDQWELCSTKRKSEFDVCESTNPLYFGFT